MGVRTIRLDRLLGNATGLTRSQAQKAVRAGTVRVDGVVVTDPAIHVAPTARVERDDEPVVLAGPQYLMLNKPLGVVCAAHDRLHRTVFDLVDVPGSVELHVAGRLDIDTTGLVLLTDDGAWSHRVTSPRQKVPKVYRATLAEPLGPQAIETLRDGVQLEGEPKRCGPALVDEISAREWRATVTEGKYHQIKRMFVAVGNHVVALHREAIGAVTLDQRLAPGEWRALTPAEVTALGGGSPPASGAGKDGRPEGD